MTRMPTPIPENAGPIDVKARFAAEAYYHIGDRELDDVVATGAGFRFLRADATAHRLWGPELFTASP